MVHTDSPARALQCPRCRAWCLIGQSNGFKTVVSAQALTVDGTAGAVSAGLDVYALSSTRKLKHLVGAAAVGASGFLAHPCRVFADTPLAAPQKPVQARRSCSPMCLGSCELCDPPPFDATRALVEELGARVVSIHVHGKEVYRDESLA